MKPQGQALKILNVLFQSLPKTSLHYLCSENIFQINTWIHMNDFRNFTGNSSSYIRE